MPFRRGFRREPGANLLFEEVGRERWSIATGSSEAPRGLRNAARHEGHLQRPFCFATSSMFGKSRGAELRSPAKDKHLGQSL